jgi:hypothetical protein
LRVVVDRVLVAGFRVRMVRARVDAGLAAAVSGAALDAAAAVLVDLVRVVALAPVVVLPVDRARVVVLADAVGVGSASCAPTAARASSRILTTIAAVAAAAVWRWSFDSDARALANSRPSLSNRRRARLSRDAAFALTDASSSSAAVRTSSGTPDDVADPPAFDADLRCLAMVHASR